MKPPGRFAPGHEIDLWPLSSEARTSATQLLNRIDRAMEATGVALHMGARPARLRGRLALVRQAAEAVLIQVQDCGGYTGPHLQAPVVGPREYFGVYLQDAGADLTLLDLAHAALVHLLMSMESRNALADLGPVDKRKFQSALAGIRKLIDSSGAPA